MRALFGRTLQYLGVGLAAHAVTMHMIVLQYVREHGDGHPSSAESWQHVSIGVTLASFFFGIGIWLERRSKTLPG